MADTPPLWGVKSKLLPLGGIFYEISTECPAFQSADEWIDQDYSFLIGIRK